MSEFVDPKDPKSSPKNNAHNMGPDGRPIRGMKGRLGLLGTAMSVGFIGLETKMNMDEGDSFLVAGGKAALTNALFTALPGGLPVGIAASMIPAIPSVIDGTQNLMRDASNKGKMFSNSFDHTETTQVLQDIGYQRQDMARREAVKAMTSHNSQYSRYF